MGYRDDGEVSKLLPGNPGLGKPLDHSSLNEEWSTPLDRCVGTAPLSDVISYLMRNCFFRRSHATWFSSCRRVMAIS